MTVINQSLMPDLTDKTITKIFLDAYRSATPEYKKLPIGLLGSDTSYEKLSSVSTVGLIPEWTGGKIPTITNEQLYDITITPKEWAAKYPVERKTLDDNKHKEVIDGIKLFGIAARETKDVWIYRVLNYADSTSYYTGGDGKALVATDHPYSPTNASTQSNKSTSALSATTLAANRVSMTKLLNAKGQPAMVKGTKLYVPVDLEDTAAELTKSSAKVAENFSSGVENVLSNITYESSVRITDANNWFLMDPMLANMMWLLINRIPLEFATTMDFDTLQKWYRMYERYETGFTNYLWMFGAIVS